MDFIYLLNRPNNKTNKVSVKKEHSETEPRNEFMILWSTDL